MKFPQSITVAKTLYALGGWLSSIKVPSRIYSLDPATGELTREKYRLFGWGFGYKVALHWGPRWDRKHWDHWALDHSDEKGSTFCADCGGFICEYADIDYED